MYIGMNVLLGQFFSQKDALLHLNLPTLIRIHELFTYLYYALYIVYNYVIINMGLVHETHRKLSGSICS